MERTYRSFEIAAAVISTYIRMRQSFTAMRRSYGRFAPSRFLRAQRSHGSNRLFAHKFASFERECTRVRMRQYAIGGNAAMNKRLVWRSELDGTNITSKPCVYSSALNTCRHVCPRMFVPIPI